MKKIYVTALLGIGLLLTGCAGQKGMPSFALVTPVKTVSVMHPDDMEDKMEGNHIITFRGVWPVEFSTELCPASADEVNADMKFVRGFWPVIAVSMNNDEVEMKKGFCYTIPDESFLSNPWREVLTECVFIGTKREFERNHRLIALANKDGGAFLASPIGYVPGYEKKILVDTAHGGIYDYKKFESDLEYQRDIMRLVGRPIQVIEKTWRERIEAHGFIARQNLVQEIEIGNNLAWKKFRKKFLHTIGNGKNQDGITLPNGDIVATYLSEDEIERVLAKNPNITGWQKFLSELRLAPGTLEMMGWSLVASGFKGGIAALMNDNCNMCVARGKAQRADMAPIIEFWVDFFKREYIAHITGR